MYGNAHFTYSYSRFLTHLESGERYALLSTGPDEGWVGKAMRNRVIEFKIAKNVPLNAVRHVQRMKTKDAKMHVVLL